MSQVQCLGCGRLTPASLSDCVLCGRDLLCDTCDHHRGRHAPGKPFSSCMAEGCPCSSFKEAPAEGAGTTP